MSVLIKLAPLLLVVLSGFTLRKLNIIPKVTGVILLKIVFYITLPALYFITTVSADLTSNLAILPIMGIVLVSAGYISAQLSLRFIKLPKKSRGAYLVSSMIVNADFVLPFLLAIYGAAAATRIALFNLGNGLLVFSWVYAIAVIYGSRSAGIRTGLSKLLTAPPTWAILLGIIFNLVGVVIPEWLRSNLVVIGAPTSFLILFALGSLVTFRLKRLNIVTLAIFNRMVIGLLTGLIVVYLFSISGITRLVLLTLAMAPIGYNSITFSALEDLDNEFAVNALSISLVLGLIFIPLVLLILGP